jgi:CHASE2 domain-containing sensor protein
VTVSYYQAIEPGLLPADMFRGKVVLIGRSLSAAAALDQPDHFRTPVAVAMPGVEIHASQLDTFLRRRTIADPFDSLLVSFGWSPPPESSRRSCCFAFHRRSASPCSAW